MSINYGRAANPAAYVMGILIPLGRPTEPERPQFDEHADLAAQLPSYNVNVLPGAPDRVSVRAIVSVHSFDLTHALAWSAADDADRLILNTSAGDVITLPDGSTATGVTGPSQIPHYIEYRDPRIKRYVARYEVELRLV